MIKKVIGILATVIIVVTLLLPITADPDATDRLQVLVIAGQSNAAYRNADVELVNEEIPLADTEVFYYGTAEKPIIYGTTDTAIYDSTFESYGLHSMISGDSWTIGGYEPSLAYSISKKTDCDVLIINTGIANASLQFLQPTNTGGVYVNEVLTRALALVDDKYTVDKIGYVWVQGESDANNSVNTYVQRFGVINDWYHDQGFDTCYMVQTRPSDSGNATEAQSLIAASDSSVKLVSTAPSTFTVANGLMSNDDLHYTQAGRLVIAEDINSKMVLKSYIADHGTAQLIEAIPALVIAGIILGVVGIMAYRRLE